MREPQVLGGLHPLAGAISNLGVLFGGAGAAILFFTSFVLWRLKQEKDFAFFLFYFAVLTSIITADDLFMLHESLLKVYCGLAEVHSYAGYVLFFVVGGVVFRKQLLQTEYFLLGIVFGLWGLSVAVDMASHSIEGLIDDNYRIMIEDGSKFLGIVTWSSYFTRVCYRKLMEVENK